MVVNILSVSINPEKYLLADIAGMTYDQAKEFFNDKLSSSSGEVYFTLNEYTVDLSIPHESRFHADGVFSGDGSDTMFNWIKVSKEKKIKWL